MAKALFVIFRNPRTDDLTELGEAIAKQLAPDNVSASSPYIYSDQKRFTLIFNPAPTIRTDGASMCMGMCEASDNLFVPGTTLPNGSYALFRSGKDKAEVASDYAASRTIWYYWDKDVFIASTSQRMAIAFLGDLQFNEKACGWFLCSGTLGPGESWDRRLQIMPPRMRIHLDQKNWKFKVERDRNFSFGTNDTEYLDTVAYKEKLKDVVKKAIENLNIKPSQWTLALSGGMDSRGLLYHLQDEKLHAVTWGLKKSMAMSGSDAQLGKKLSAMCDMPHRYAETDFKEGGFPIMIDRFIEAGEGRVDHLSGYFDGLELWGNLSATGRGIIRGYDAFGRKPPVTNAYQVRRTCNLLMADYTGAKIPEKFRITEKDIPEYLRQDEGESLEDWRDRLWLEHRTPVTTAALEDIKLAYVEIVNPLLSQEVVRTVQTLPEELRTNKKVWDTIVSNMFPGVPFARREAIQEVGEVLNFPDVRKYICDSLLARQDTDLFSKDFLTYLVNNYGKDYQKEAITRKLRRWIKAYLPNRIENMIRAKVNPGSLSHQWLATRTLMILKTRDMLIADSRLAKAVRSHQ